MIVLKKVTKLKKGKIVVLTTTAKNRINAEAGETIVFYMGVGFPMKEFQRALDAGEYEAREASPEEKEFCYYCIEKLDQPGAQISEMDAWRELKKQA